MPPKFTHLHVHSHYSLLDGLAKIPELVKRTAELGMDALALTDHGVMYGAIEFYKTCRKHNIKPIIGQEFYLAAGSLYNKQPKVDEVRYHLILLCENNTGYQNLIKLTTAAHLDGFYYKPRLDKELLKKYSSGLIALSGCLSGEIAKIILSGNLEKAEDAIGQYQEIFGTDNFFLEISHHPNIKENALVNEALIKLSQKLNAPLVATQDVHYLNSDDKEAQDILMAVQTGAKLDQDDRPSLKIDDFSLRSPEEMSEFFKDLPQALENTQIISQRCRLDLNLNQTKLPYFEVPTGETPDSFLKKLCYKGLKKRYGENITLEIKSRLDYELEVIQKTGFVAYFLIVQDFVNWAKSQGIVVGPGRGSVPGSLVSYALNITNIDPIKYNLLFERFLNPDRISMPDIDLDFTDTRRDEVIEYVAQKYGRDKVAQIITFGTMAARAAIRDTGRAMGLPYSFCDHMAKIVPFNATLSQALATTELKQLYETDPQAKHLLDTAKKLEGVARHASTHACGVIITKEPLKETVPLQYASRDDKTIITQYEMHAIEDLGLLKMDFLGLKNLTIIERALKLIQELRGIKINIDNIALDDPAAFKLLQQAKTTGVFQLESNGMKRYLKELKPTELEDIIAMVSLYRPGPMELIPTYIKRKHGQEPITYLHPKLEPILKNTYGIMVYQEQLMVMTQELAGLTLAEADTFRRAVGKKIKSLLLEQRAKLISGMAQNGVELKTAEAIWALVEPFARYGFNRCLAGETKVTDPQTGLPITLEELYKQTKNIISVASLTDAYKIKPNLVKNVFYNGKKPVFKVTTRSGRTIKATANHPFLTPGGWRMLEGIKLGEKLAVPRSLPEPTKPIIIEQNKLGLLGYLLAEGNFCHPHGFYFYSKNSLEIKDYLACLNSFSNTTGKIDSSKSAVAIYAKRKNLAQPAQAVVWIESLGLKYKKAAEKFFPDFVYQLNNHDLALLLGKMFQGDGCINIKRSEPQIFYATSSPALAAGCQHLLLRLGILSTIHTKKFKYRSGIKIGYTITISRYNNIEIFIKTIAQHLIGQKKIAAEKILADRPIINGSLSPWAGRGSYDIVPVELVRPYIRAAVLKQGFSFAEFAKQNNISKRLFLIDKRKIGYLRETLSLIGQGLNDHFLLTLAESNIYWDEIVRIEPAGIQKTYDLTIESTHNFVANDIIAHNSHGASYAMIAYQTAYLKANYPQEFMCALLNSESADIERISFLISEAKDFDLSILPPDINESFKDFTLTPEKNNVIRFGLEAIKNVGTNVVESLIAERQINGPFKNMTDFLSRIESRDLNKKSLESLIKTGALDSLGERNEFLINLDQLLNFSKEIKQARLAKQTTIFDGLEIRPTLKLKLVEPAEMAQKLIWEKELLGLYLSDHPLSPFKDRLEKETQTIKTLLALETAGKLNKSVKVGGILSRSKKIMTKTGRPMIFAQLQDFADEVEIVVFPDILEKNPDLWQLDRALIVQGRAQMRDGSLKIICQDAFPLDNQRSV